MADSVASATITFWRLSDPGHIQVPIVVPRKLGNVRLIREIGRGGMGVVWLARDEMLSRDVAVKLLLEIVDEDDPSFRQFLEGARAAARVRHQGLTTIYEADLVEGIPYLVMEYVEGPTLSKVVKATGQLDVPITLAVLSEACGAIGALHAKEIIHRDIKPGNILLNNDGQIFVTDFGLTCPRRSEFAAGIAGTPSYMAPEMFEGIVSARSDVYALGIMSFQMLSGSLPFEGTVSELYEQHQDKPLPINVLGDLGIDEELTEVLRRATHKNATFRYKSADYFLQAFRAATKHKVLARTRDHLAGLVGRTSSKPLSEIPSPTPNSPPYYEQLSLVAEKKRQSSLHSGVSDAESKDAEPCEQGQIIADIACGECIYNLRGIKTDANCPECGTPVFQSIVHDRLIFASKPWLRKLTIGLYLVFGFNVFSFLFGLLLQRFNLLSELGKWIGVTLVLGSFVGIYLATSAESKKAASIAIRKFRWISLMLCPITILLPLFAIRTSSRLNDEHREIRDRILYLYGEFGRIEADRVDKLDSKRDQAKVTEVLSGERERDQLLSQSGSIILRRKYYEFGFALATFAAYFTSLACLQFHSIRLARRLPDRMLVRQLIRGGVGLIACLIPIVLVAYPVRFLPKSSPAWLETTFFVGLTVLVFLAWSNTLACVRRLAQKIQTAHATAISFESIFSK